MQVLQEVDQREGQVAFSQYQASTSANLSNRLSDVSIVQAGLTAERTATTDTDDSRDCTPPAQSSLHCPLKLKLWLGSSGIIYACVRGSLNRGARVVFTLERLLFLFSDFDFRVYWQRQRTPISGFALLGGVFVHELWE